MHLFLWPHLVYLLRCNRQPPALKLTRNCSIMRSRTCQGRPATAGLRAATQRACTTRRHVIEVNAKIQLTWRVRKQRSDPSLPAPTIDYVARMTAAQQDPSACPLLMLAPMESLGDWRFRQAISSTTGGFDEACTEFIRIPNRADHPRAAVKGIVVQYDARELPGAIPLGAQVMSSSAELLGIAADMLVDREAPRIDLNCGCPANTVTGSGAGSSLLRTPEVLHGCVSSMVKAAAGRRPVSVKMRSGYEDTSLFEENLLAAQEAGASFITIHPRTKRQTYDGRADWTLIARARQLLRIPVVGNGDVVSVAAARKLVQETGCGAIMVGRGAVTDPFLFWRIRASYERPDLPWEWDEPEAVQWFLRAYAASCLKAPAPASPVLLPNGQKQQQQQQQGELEAVLEEDGVSTSGRAPSDGLLLDGNLAMSRTAFFGRMKKIMRYLFSSEPELRLTAEGIFRAQPSVMTADDLVELLCEQLARHWPRGGPSQRLLVNHMNKTLQVVESSCGYGSSSCDESPVTSLETKPAGGLLVNA